MLLFVQDCLCVYSNIILRIYREEQSLVDYTEEETGDGIVARWLYQFAVQAVTGNVTATVRDRGRIRFR